MAVDLNNRPKKEKENYTIKKWTKTKQQQQQQKGTKKGREKWDGKGFNHL